MLSSVSLCIYKKTYLGVKGGSSAAFILVVERPFLFTHIQKISMVSIFSAITIHCITLHSVILYTSFIVIGTVPLSCVGFKLHTQGIYRKRRRLFNNTVTSPHTFISLIKALSYSRGITIVSLLSI